MATQTYTRTVKAPAKMVYNAFTQDWFLCEWFCDDATIRPRVPGYFFATWNVGYFTAGNFTALEEAKQIAFTWLGSKDDPAKTQVDVTLAEQDGGTLVTVNHSDIGTGDEWKETSARFERIWTQTLENLQSILETGIDLRISRRPMLGIFPNELDSELAQKLGIPVKEGIHLTSVLPTMGAASAGLQKDDVIVELDGKPITDYASLPVAIGSHIAGDVVDVAYYRGAEKHTVKLKFAQRPLFDLFATAGEFADRVQNLHNELDSELRAVFAGISDEQGSKRPAAKEWNAREVVAHLIWSERWLQSWVGSLVEEAELEGWPGNSFAVVDAVADGFTTNEAILNEMKRSQDETVRMIRALPDEFLARKGSYHRAIQQVLTYDTHNREHFEQVREALAAARQPLAAAVGG